MLLPVELLLEELLYWDGDTPVLIGATMLLPVELLYCDG